MKQSSEHLEAAYEATGHTDVASVPVTSAQEVAPASLPRPLCVDLDGTLVKSDTFIESIFLLIRRNPLMTIQIAFWLVRSRAIAKREVTLRVAIDAASLPLNRPVVDYLRSQKAQDRKIYLFTGADSRLANQVAEHLGLFEGVLASNGSINLIGRKKREILWQQFGESGYDYIGNSYQDIPVLERAGNAMLANPSPLLNTVLGAKSVRIERRFEDRGRFVSAALRAMRPYQWTKNLLVLTPFILAHSLTAQKALSAAIAFLCFSLCASSTYIVNDLLDVEADRHHPTKKKRPFAAGELSTVSGIALAAFCCALGMSSAYRLLPIHFLMWLGLYLVATLGYSLYLKRLAIADVILLAGLYTVRVLAGGSATHVSISPWLSAFSMFLFLSLAIAKRFSELQSILRAGVELNNGRGYLLADLEQLRSFGTASGYASAVVFSLYISGHNVAVLYSHPTWLWLIVPLMIFWLSRLWLLAGRGDLHEDPVIFAITDRLSLLIGGMAALIAILAAQ